MNICRTFSMDNKKQHQNLIETLKQKLERAEELIATLRKTYMKDLNQMRG